MSVYEPAEDSYFLQKYVQEYAFGKVLDLGTGSGIQALTAAEDKKVKLVLAVDINEEAIKSLKTKVKRENIPKIKVKQSDLFSKLLPKNKFDTIIFNPPYLPQDKISGKIIEDKAIYGGKKGWEISEKFFQEVSQYLAPQGKILFLFSSLTNKKKIDELIKHNLFSVQELGRCKLAFEELYVYLIKKTYLRKELEKKKINAINYFTHGKRGDVYQGKWHSKKVIIKINRAESKAQNRMENEVYWLKILNKKKIGPKLFFSGDNYSGVNYLVMEFILGDFFPVWLTKHNPREIKMVLKNIFQQCFIMDKLNVNKEEMHHPYKHILVKKNNQPVLIDFERCKKTTDTKNVTQFVEYVCRLWEELTKKGLSIKVEQLRMLAQKYKREPSQKNLQFLLKSLN